MNPFGSYRALLGNALSALASAIEIYNKPRIQYREECTVILLVNAWELLLKAILSKERVRIFYPKRRNQPYRTYSLSDALNRATPFFPAAADFDATAKNLELLVEYRDNAVHFYNQPGFGVLIYALAQTAITNFRDLVKAVFAKDLSAEVNLSLLPLALGTPLDPIEFVKARQADATTPRSVRQFTARLRDLVADLETNGRDTGRLFTVFRTQLVSTKKIGQADFTVGVQAGAGAGPPILVQRAIDPNRTHPYRESDIITRAGHPGGLGIVIGETPLTQFPFRAVGYHLKAKEDPKYCWADRTGAVTRYSDSYVERLRALQPEELSSAIRAYRRRVEKRQELGCPPTEKLDSLLPQIGAGSPHA